MKPRPKPKPRYKGPAAAATSSTEIQLPSVPQPLSAPPIDFLDSPLSIADRAKSRARKSTQKPSIIDIIDIPTDSEDELQFLPPSRTKSKAKTPVIEIPDTQPTLPIPTSEASSQLPPSDPISTPELPPQSKDDDSPLTSPEKPPKKRKRPRTDHDANDDAMMMPPPAMPEPPPFFAPSSSSSGFPEPDLQGPPVKKPAKKKKRANDDEDGSPKKKKAPAKPRKKKGDLESSAAPSFKSAEFIDELDDEDAGASPSRRTPNLRVEVVIPRKRLISHEDEFEEDIVVDKGKKRQKKKADEGDEDEYGYAPLQEEAVKPKTIKRKKKAADDDEEDYGAAPAEKVAKPKAAKKPKAPPKAKPKAKGKVPQEEEEPAVLDTSTDIVEPPPDEPVQAEEDTIKVQGPNFAFRNSLKPSAGEHSPERAG